MHINRLMLTMLVGLYLWLCCSGVAWGGQDIPAPAYPLGAFAVNSLTYGFYHCGLKLTENEAIVMAIATTATIALSAAVMPPVSSTGGLPQHFYRNIAMSLGGIGWSVALIKW